VIEVPQRFDERNFESFAQAFARAAQEPRVLVDAHANEWISPFGFVTLLAAGEALRDRHGGAKPLLTAPADRDKAHFWARMGFFTHAREIFEVHGNVPRVKGGESRVLLEVTPVRAAEDVHAVVHHIQEKSAAILTEELGLDSRATIGFGMALSEACQNIVEHAGTGGWVCVHTYTWWKNTRVAVIAVADAGVGFRQTLEASQAARYGERWGDGAALEAALLQSVSRFRDPGRGQGLAGIRRYLGRWQGKISIRSGTARIAIIPPWEDDVPLTEGLAPFPGAQVQLVIPAGAQDSR
jgi:anti-sigma regulatory factor (Ser/Thr protein kinase)